MAPRPSEVDHSAGDGLFDRAVETAPHDAGEPAEGDNPNRRGKGRRLQPYRAVVSASAVGGMRPIHQQAPQSPKRNPIVGTTSDCVMNVSRKMTVPRSTNPMICLKVSIHAPGFGRNAISLGNAPIKRYGLAIPRPTAIKTA